MNSIELEVCEHSGGSVSNCDWDLAGMALAHQAQAQQAGSDSSSSTDSESEMNWTRIWNVASQLGQARRLFAGPFEKKEGKYIPPPKF